MSKVLLTPCSLPLIDYSHTGTQCSVKCRGSVPRRCCNIATQCCHWSKLRISVLFLVSELLRCIRQPKAATPARSCDPPFGPLHYFGSQPWLSVSPRPLQTLEGQLCKTLRLARDIQQEWIELNECHLAKEGGGVGICVGWRLYDSISEVSFTWERTVAYLGGKIGFDQMPFVGRVLSPTLDVTPSRCRIAPSPYPGSPREMYSQWVLTENRSTRIRGTDLPFPGIYPIQISCRAWGNLGCAELDEGARPSTPLFSSF